MAVHSSRTARARYARTAGFQKSMTAEGIDLYRSRSDRWQIWLGLLPRMPKDDMVVRTRVGKEVELPTEEKVALILKKMYGASGKWRSEKQREAIEATIEGVSPLIIVLPTGGGKSLTFMGPAKLDEAGIY